MATATAAQQHEMVERKEPLMVQFTKENEDVEGVLVGVELVNVKGKQTCQYLLRDPDGVMFTFLQTYDIGRKLNKGDIGHFVTVRYEGEDKSIVTQGSPLKRFKVMVSKRKVVADTLTITDDDIPEFLR